MGYSESLKRLFPGITLEAEDLFSLEDFQIKYLPDRVPEKEFSVLLRAHPAIHRFLEIKYPPIAIFINRILSENQPAENDETIEESCQELLWEIADLIIYDKYPDVYDAQSGITWNISEITSITSLEGKTVLDAGAGTGRIAFLVADYAEIVFAMEPVTNLRRFMKEKADRENVNNLFVVDGFLDSIPFPDKYFDVLMTSNAIGWNLMDELREIERVLKPGAHAIHLLHAEDITENPMHDMLVSHPWDYSFSRSVEEEGLKLKYFKTVL